MLDLLPNEARKAVTDGDAEGTAAGATPARMPSDWVVSVHSAFPHMTNPLGTLFGGEVLGLMDVAASISAQRFCRRVVVTASTEPIDFRNPIYVGEIIEIKARVARTGTSSMIIRCEVHGENPLTGDRRLCTIGHLNFVALGDDGRPTPVPSLEVRDELERAHWTDAGHVRDGIARRREQEPLRASPR